MKHKDFVELCLLTSGYSKEELKKIDISKLNNEEIANMIVYREKRQ